MSTTFDEKITINATPVPAPANGFENGVRLRRWTVEEYHRAGELGILRPEEHLELIEGELFEKMSEDPQHSLAIDLVLAALAQTFSLADYYLRGQHPITLATSEPEPDIAVAIGNMRNYRTQHPRPADIALIVEVANTTLLYDRRTKAGIYAAAGIGEYWILNLTDRRLEVHRLPQDGVYQQITFLAATQNVSPLAAATTSIAVRDLLP